MSDSAKCPCCGRFMAINEYQTTEELDSLETFYTCQKKCGVIE